MASKNFIAAGLRFIFILGLSLGFWSNSYAQQQNFAGYFYPEFSLEVPAGRAWTFEITLKDQYYAYQEGQFDFEGKTLRLDGAVSRSLGHKQAVSLGFKYYIESIYDLEADNKVRITEAYKHFLGSTGDLDFTGRFKFEQETDRFFHWLKSRYKLKMKFPLIKSQDPLKQLFMSISPEMIWEVEKGERSVFEQRLEVALSKDLAKAISAKMGLEYRIKDYTAHPFHKLILKAGVTAGL